MKILKYIVKYIAAFVCFFCIFFVIIVGGGIVAVTMVELLKPPPPAKARTMSKTQKAKFKNIENREFREDAQGRLYFVHNRQRVIL